MKEKHKLPSVGRSNFFGMGFFFVVVFLCCFVYAERVRGCLNWLVKQLAGVVHSNILAARYTSDLGVCPSDQCRATSTPQTAQLRLPGYKLPLPQGDHIV